MIAVSNLSHSFGGAPVLNDLSFTIQSNERIGIVGPSGSGKSVLLKCLCGVITPEQGEVSAPEGENSFGMLFQESALFDSMSVLENVAFPLRSQLSSAESLPREELYHRAYVITDTVKLLLLLVQTSWLGVFLSRKA